MSEFVKELNSSNFNETIENNDLVLVDVWTNWCGPCKVMLPTIDDLGEHYQNSVVVSKLDADLNSNLASSLGVRSIPTLILFKNGEEVERSSGIKTKQQLISMIEKYQN